METLTLQQSTIRGVVLGKPVQCMVRASSGLQLPPGDYWLRLAENNPVYGQVMSIEPLAGASGESDLKAAPSALKDTPFSREAAPSIKFDGAPSIKFDSAPSIKFDSAPAIKFDSAAGGLAQSVVLSDRSIAGNGFVVTAGFADLIALVQRAGGIRLVVM